MTILLLKKKKLDWKILGINTLSRRSSGLVTQLQGIDEDYGYKWFRKEGWEDLIEDESKSQYSNEESEMPYSIIDTVVQSHFNRSDRTGDLSPYRISFRQNRKSRPSRESGYGEFYRQGDIHDANSRRFKKRKSYDGSQPDPIDDINVSDGSNTPKHQESRELPSQDFSNFAKSSNALTPNMQNKPSYSSSKPKKLSSFAKQCNI
jgi:hypothetical protein